MTQYQIAYTMPSAPADTVEAAAGQGVGFGTHWAILVDDSGDLVWAAPREVVLSIKALPDPTPATAPTAGA